ncbi:MAG TPA: M42 family metallopeptidase [Ignavibacteria bacterium]|nr:glucanase [Bacteroidota bacterium]HRI84197.1 M42 family metallopeptidase [Ignavibacteria bacterium]HRJ98350.1 M42 family metallopeptidase [Ignavibacteria bacterium]
MENVIATLESILKINSPTGYTAEVINHISSLFDDDSSIIKTFTNKGSLLISFDESPELLLTAHIDTLGAMVKEIKSNGTLEVTQLGSYPWNSFESEYVSVRNSKGKIYRGTFLMNNPAAHVNDKLSSEKREQGKMSIRLDELVNSESDVKKLGINTGDFVFYDIRYEYTKSGFVKSRFLDDKACAAILIELIKELSKSIKDKKNKKNLKAAFYFSNYEEVGHGSAIGIPGSVKELLVLDMAVIGDGCTGEEDAVSICVKDSSGPYDFHVSKKLKELAEKNNIKHNVDIYPYYGSDGSAALLAGYDVRVGLIGPGVSASHGAERTHRKGIAETYKLAKAYINNF